MIKQISISNVRERLKRKTILFALWNCESDSGWTRYQFYEPLKNIFRQVIPFDPRKRRFMYGPEKMKVNFLNLIREKKPDYAFMQFGSDEINIDMIEEINKISPKTKTIGLFTDDDTDYILFTQYYALFLDYCMATQPEYLHLYKKDGLKNFFKMVGTNIELFNPSYVSKKYEVTFVGQYYPPRAEVINYLLKKGVNIKVWGNSKWADNLIYKRAFCGGPIGPKEYADVMNKSKIVLGLVKNQYGNVHISHRPFEASACKAFQILDYAPEYWNYLKKDKEIIMFKDKEDLLRKIEHYLKNEKKREEIAERAHKRVRHSYNINIELLRFFGNILKDEKNFSRRKIPTITKKLIELSDEDINMDKKHIINYVRNYDFVSFSKKEWNKHKYKDFIQMYCLEKTKKDICCCDYYLSNKNLGTIMVSKTSRYFKFQGEEKTKKILHPAQIFVTKKYFIKNLNNLKRFVAGKGNLQIKENNISFISIPLITISNIEDNYLNVLNNLSKSELEKAFQLNFFYILYSLFHRRRFFTDIYLYKLLLFSLRNGFISKYLLSSLKTREFINRIFNIN